jgi:hypothetical protein
MPVSGRFYKGHGLDSVFVLDANPNVTGQYRSVRTDSELVDLQVFLIVFHHAGMNQAQIRNSSVLLVIILHGFLNFYI